jgi:hypothetical protein
MKDNAAGPPARGPRPRRPGSAPRGPRARYGLHAGSTGATPSGVGPRTLLGAGREDQGHAIGSARAHPGPGDRDPEHITLAATSRGPGGRQSCGLGESLIEPARCAIRVFLRHHVCSVHLAIFLGHREDFSLARRTKAVSFDRSRDPRGDVVDIALPTSSPRARRKGKPVPRQPVSAGARMHAIARAGMSRIEKEIVSWR